MKLTVNSQATCCVWLTTAPAITQCVLLLLHLVRAECLQKSGCTSGHSHCESSLFEATYSWFSAVVIFLTQHDSQFHYTGLETHDWLLRFFGVVWSAKHSESNGKLLSIKLPSQQYPSLDGITWFFCNFCFIRWSSAVRRPALKEFSDVVFPCLARRFWRIFLCLWVVTEEFSYVFELSYTVQLKAQLVLHLFLNHICKDDKSNGNRICWLFIIAAFLIICQRS